MTMSPKAEQASDQEEDQQEETNSKQWEEGEEERETKAWTIKGVPWVPVMWSW
jgi:hypothetical protein